MRKQLLMFELLEIADKAGLSKSDFSKETFYYAQLYKTIIWVFALLFCNEKRKDCENESTEYNLDEEGKVKEIYLALSFRKKKMKRFVKFVSKNQKCLPSDLKKSFRLDAGICDHYGDGGLVIYPRKIRYLKPVEYQELYEDTEGSLTDEIINRDAYKKLRIIRDELLILLKGN